MVIKGAIIKIESRRRFLNRNKHNIVSVVYYFNNTYVVGWRKVMSRKKNDRSIDLSFHLLKQQNNMM